MAHAIVHGAFSQLTAVDMGNGNAGRLSRQYGCQNFETVTQDHDDIGAEVRQSFAHSLDDTAHRGGNIGGGISLHVHWDAGIDLKFIIGDFSPCLAEGWLEVHASDRYLQGKTFVIANRLHQPAQQAVFGAASRDDANRSFSHCWALPASDLMAG